MRIFRRCRDCKFDLDRVSRPAQNGIVLISLGVLVKRFATLFLTIVPLFVVADVWASRLKVTGLYSNMRFGTEDVTGVEIFLVFSRAGYYAVMQCAEGAPGVPMTLPAKVAGNSIEIEPPSSKASMCPNAIFRGTIKASGIRGAFEGTAWPGFLKRGKSYWQ